MSTPLTWRRTPIVAIDPGSAESAYCAIDEDLRPVAFGKIPNEELLESFRPGVADRVVIEMVSSYGMPVGEEVFETVLWTGRFVQAFYAMGIEAERIKRGPVKLHHCHSSRAKDSNITQALVDRFTPGQSNYGKGTKAKPGFFHGFYKDIWQAMALAVYAADTEDMAA